jgi:putative endonuclease
VLGLHHDQPLANSLHRCDIRPPPACVCQHKSLRIDGFTRRYQMIDLAYFEATPNIRAAIEREKQIKGWSRSKKIALIESRNPEWRDCAADWCDEPGDSSGLCPRNDTLNGPNPAVIPNTCTVSSRPRVQ